MGEKPMRNKEQAILEAAEREFIVKGFAGARTTSIAEAAGVTHAMLHYYFRTKEQLFERILDEKMRLMGESVLAAFGQPGLPLAERLRDGIERHFDFIMANPDMPRFIVNEVFSRPERYETMQARIREIAGVLMCDILYACQAHQHRNRQRQRYHFLHNFFLLLVLVACVVSPPSLWCTLLILADTIAFSDGASQLVCGNHFLYPPSS